MPKLKDYEILAPFSADELIQNANALLRPIPEAQLQKRTLRFYSSQGLLPPPEGPRSKAKYGYEHLVILVALRLFKHLGLKLDVVEEVIRNQRMEGIEKLAETVQQYLDKLSRTHSIQSTLAEETLAPFESLIGERYAFYSGAMQHWRSPGFVERLTEVPSSPLPVKKTTRLQLSPGVTLEFDEDKPVRKALQEAYQKLRQLLGKPF